MERGQFSSRTVLRSILVRNRYGLIILCHSLKKENVTEWSTVRYGPLSLPDQTDLCGRLVAGSAQHDNQVEVLVLDLLEKLVHCDARLMLALDNRNVLKARDGHLNVDLENEV